MNKSIYIAFAKEDEKQYDLLLSELEQLNSDLDVLAMIEKYAYKAQWKSDVRTKIRNSIGVIILVSKNTLNSSAQKFEINSVLEEGKPILSISAYKNDRTRMMGLKTKPWDADSLKEFILQLE